MRCSKAPIEPDYLELHAQPFLHHRQGRPGVPSSSSEGQVRQATCRLQNPLPLLPLPPPPARLLKPLELKPGLGQCESEREWDPLILFLVVRLPLEVGMNGAGVLWDGVPSLGVDSTVWPARSFAAPTLSLILRPVRAADP
jgi:hypothetical protein